MGKLIKFVAITLVATFMVVFLGSALAIGERAYSYMSRQKFDLPTAIEWAKDDFEDWFTSIWGNNDKETIISFDMCNKHIEIVACTALD